MISFELFDSFRRMSYMSQQKFERSWWNFRKWKDDLYLQTSKRGVLYGLTEIHEALEDGITLFCQILSAIGTPAGKQFATNCTEP